MVISLHKLCFFNYIESPEVILKKINVLFPLILATCFTQIASAKDEVASVKKSCLKDYPLAVGDTDLEIIGYYNQLCDKKNKKNEALKNELMVDLAKKYQTTGYNLKALQVVNLLRSKNYHSPDLTDVTFLAGVSISHNALNQMRSNEGRTLDENTYSPAKVLADNIRYIQPSMNKSQNTTADSRDKNEPVSNVKPKRTAPAKAKRTTSTKSNSVKQKKTTTTAVKRPAAPPTRQRTSGASPFDTLKK